MTHTTEQHLRPKTIDWRGSSLDDLKQLPLTLRALAGRELRKVQFGEDPADFKVIADWGAGVVEIRLNDEHHSGRVVYVAKFAERLYVLHSFIKKSQKTRNEDVVIIKTRYREVIAERTRSKV
ncbi:hypothetical protein GKQ23_15260 [Erwinia sp. E602]|uniref:type II toxin-antitoxin system RelE/ParE family toxin n=1 Tax=unclassified Erwinia TaxID=2622719 RepID=UPI0006F4756A|nr:MULTISPECIES: type II toxin-antitoxin system RelE/ParE family toxin [unclassified Erwinia]KQN56642.1 hypothetical protein ASF13_05845 [Erwinia sp. Leaf53]PLV61399.1 hypothetical protein NV64_09670 [Erwinia sp. B116]QUG76273.1 hypothetical protein GKQ23_15260 [Erwinia sp. E602]